MKPTKKPTPRARRGSSSTPSAAAKKNLKALRTKNEKPKDYKVEIRGIHGFDNTQRGKKFTGHIGFIIQWSADGIGWGETTFYFDVADGKFKVDTECMSDAFVKAVMDEFVRICERAG